MRAYLRDVPPAALEAMRLPALDASTHLDGEFAYMHMFTTSQRQLDVSFPLLQEHLTSAGMLWVSWPKAGRLNSDLTLRDVIRIGYSHGLVESTCLSIDTTWSALKFTHPKPGKTYRNSYGQLGFRA